MSLSASLAWARVDGWVAGFHLAVRLGFGGLSSHVSAQCCLGMQQRLTQDHSWPSRHFSTWCCR